MHICSVQVATQEAIRCPAFLLWEAATAHAPPIRLKRLFFISPPQNVEKWEGIKSLRWDERTPRGKERETETETKSKRVSCGLNSDQLFKACACSWVWAALIKDAVSEQATDAREGGTPRLTRRGWGVEQHHLSGPQQSNKKLLNNNYRASKYYWLSTFSTSYIKSI